MDLASISRLVTKVRPRHVLSGASVARHILKLRMKQWQPPEILRETQLRKLKALIRHGYDNVPYYRKLFDSAGFHPNDLASLDDLRKIPITTKQDVRENFSDMLSRTSDTSKNKLFHTSGSSGVPLNIVRDREAQDYSMALKAYAFFECGVRPTDKFITIAQSEDTILPNQLSFAATANTADAVNHLRRTKPDVIYCYPSVLSRIVAHDVSGIAPRLIFSQGLKLTQTCRDLFVSKFGVEVFDTYGSVEFSRLAFECGAHSGLHMITDCAVMEFLREGQPVDPGEPGVVVVTTLYSHAMPLIRYQLDDIAVPTDEICSCGRTWPLIESIEGRALDIFTMPSGKKVSPGFLYYGMHESTKEDVNRILQFQIVQTKRDEIVVNIVKGTNFRLDDLRRIKARIERQFLDSGEKILVNVRTVDEIPIERTGKSRIMKSLVD